MNIKQSTLAAAVTAALAMGVSTQAAAYVYAESTLDLQNLSIKIYENGVAAPQPITSFQFTITNTATLNGVSAPTSTSQCGGTPGAGTGNDCGVAIALDTNPANAPGGTVNRANNDFTLFGPGTDQYSNSDSVIYSAQLTLDPTTHIQQIASSELQGGASASANAEIQSSTGFNMTFTINGTGSMEIDWEADPYLRAAILDPVFDNGNAKATMEVNVTLTQESTGDAVSWDPNGVVTATGCDSLIAGVACVEDADGETLNISPNVTTNGGDVPRSAAVGFSLFGITISGLSTGVYNLALNAVTSTQLRRVPEPGMLALLGMGLLGMGVASRRRNVRV